MTDDGGGLSRGAVESIVEDIFAELFMETLVQVLFDLAGSLIDYVLLVLNTLRDTVAAVFLPVAGSVVSAGSWFAGNLQSAQAGFAESLTTLGLAAPFAVAAAWAASIVVMAATVWFIIGLLESLPIVQTAVEAVTGVVDGAQTVASTLMGSLFGGDSE